MLSGREIKTIFLYSEISKTDIAKHFDFSRPTLNKVINNNDQKTSTMMNCLILTFVQRSALIIYMVRSGVQSFTSSTKLNAKDA